MADPILLNINLFPPIDYMAMVLYHPMILIEAHENYQKQTLRNRYYIGGPNGVQFLQVPVAKCGKGPCPIMRMEVDDALPWRLIHVRSLETAYNKSPWFLYYRDEIENLLLKNNTSLWELCLNALMVTALLIKKKPSIELTTQYSFSPEDTVDLRALFGQKPVTGFQQKFPDLLPYEQVFSAKYGFTSGLSILDLLFNEGPAANAYLEQRYRQLLPHLDIF